MKTRWSARAVGPLLVAMLASLAIAESAGAVPTSPAVAGQVERELPEVLVITAVADGNTDNMNNLVKQMTAAWGGELSMKHIRITSEEIPPSQMSEYRNAIDGADRIVVIDVLWGDAKQRNHPKARTMKPVAEHVAKWWRTKSDQATHGETLSTCDMVLDGRIWAESGRTDYFTQLLRLLGSDATWLVVASDHSTSSTTGFPLLGANVLLEQSGVTARFRADDVGGELTIKQDLAGLRTMNSSVCSIQSPDDAEHQWIALAVYKNHQNRPAIVRRRRSVEWNVQKQMLEIMRPAGCVGVSIAVVDAALRGVSGDLVAGGMQVWPERMEEEEVDAVEREPAKSGSSEDFLIIKVPPPSEQGGEGEVDARRPRDRAVLVTFEMSSGARVERWIEIPAATVSP